MGKSKVKSQKSKAQVKSQKFFYFCFLLLPFSLSFFTFNCYAQPVPSTELINNAKQYDGKTVIYTGEVIGDVMRRGKSAWINVNDGKNAIGVWILADLTKSIQFIGNYKSKGDLVEITGVFHRSCQEHGGDLDIHAESLRKIASGRLVYEDLNMARAKSVLTLGGILGLVWILSLLKHR